MDLLIFGIFKKYWLENLWISLRTCALQAWQVLALCPVGEKVENQALVVLSTFVYSTLNKWYFVVIEAASILSLN